VVTLRMQETFITGRREHTGFWLCSEERQLFYIRQSQDNEKKSTERRAQGLKCIYHTLSWNQPMFKNWFT